MLPGVGSALDADTLAVSLSVVGAAGAVTTIEIAGAAPVASVGSVHVTVPPACVHVQPVPVALTNVVPVGIVSVTVSWVAVIAEVLVTVAVYVSVAPVATGSGESVSAIERSATTPVTVVICDPLLLPAVGSLLVELTVAVSVTVPPAAGMVTTIVIFGAAPGASVGRVHVTVPPACVQVQPVPVALTNVAPGGSVSVTVMPVAWLGPLFVTTTV